MYNTKICWNIIRKLCEKDVEKIAQLMVAEAENNYQIIYPYLKELNELTSKAMEELKNDSKKNV